MEEKIAKLMLKAKEISKNSSKYYVDVEYSSNLDKLAIDILSKSHKLIKEIRQYDYSENLNDLDMIFLNALEDNEKELANNK